MLRGIFAVVRAKAKYAVLAGVAVIAMSVSAGTASAGGWNFSIGNYGGYGGYNTYRVDPYHTYHGPSVHYHRQLHVTPHWTPYRGWHTHSHIDYVPHYVPGHTHHHHD
jgi:hypothetical protein